MIMGKLLSWFLCFLSFKTAFSVLSLDKQGEIIIKNFYESAEGKVFSKPGSLLSNQTTKSTKECCFKCVQNKECLSVNTIALNQSRCQCELLNWAGTGFENNLIPKPNSKYLQMETACSPNPCQNGGQCTVKDGGTNYTCNCTGRGHTGRNCEINMCSPNPCQNGGQCTVKDGGTNYTCTCTNHTGRNCELKCALFDFESGRLDGWTLTGTAFNNQPTYGDNSLARGVESAKLKGDWYIATFENRPSPSHPVGAQKKIPMGNATSPPFVIRGTKIRFLLGGDIDINTLRFELLIDGVVVDKTTSTRRSFTMTQREFNVSSRRGQEARVRIVDMTSTGVICVDHIEDSCYE